MWSNGEQLKLCSFKMIIQLIEQRYFLHTRSASDIEKAYECNFILEISAVNYFIVDGLSGKSWHLENGLRAGDR